MSLCSHLCTLHKTASMPGVLGSHIHTDSVSGPQRGEWSSVDNQGETPTLESEVRDSDLGRQPPWRTCASHCERKCS